MIQLQLLFKNKNNKIWYSEFKTLIGGFVSFATFVVLGLYIYLMFRVMIDKDAF